jgi:tetratricopeptide (TPR) repeat protein
MAWLALRQPDAAIADFSDALAIDDGFIAAYYSRGLAYYEKGNLQLARQDYNRAKAINPQLAEGFYDQGYVRTFVGGELNRR